MTDELKPCPFCGGEAELRSWDWPYQRFQVRCGHCGSHARGRAAKEAEAITAWNTRTETRVQATIDELVAGLAAIVDGEIERPLGTRWREDKKPSKHDRCIHGVWMYECCGGCIDAHVLAILSRHGESK